MRPAFRIAALCVVPMLAVAVGSAPSQNDYDPLRAGFWEPIGIIPYRLDIHEFNLSGRDPDKVGVKIKEGMDRLGTRVQAPYIPTHAAPPALALSWILNEKDLPQVNAILVGAGTILKVGQRKGRRAPEKERLARFQLAKLEAESANMERLRGKYPALYELYDVQLRTLRDILGYVDRNRGKVRVMVKVYVK